MLLHKSIVLPSSLSQPRPRIIIHSFLSFHFLPHPFKLILLFSSCPHYSILTLSLASHHYPSIYLSTFINVSISFYFYSFLIHLLSFISIFFYYCPPNPILMSLSLSLYHPVPSFHPHLSILFNSHHFYPFTFIPPFLSFYLLLSSSQFISMFSSFHSHPPILILLSPSFDSYVLIFVPHPPIQIPLSLSLLYSSPFPYTHPHSCHIVLPSLFMSVYLIISMEEQKEDCIHERVNGWTA